MPTVEYHSVCPLVRIGTPHPLFRKRVCPPRTKGWGGALACGLRGPNLDDCRKSMALCLLCGHTCSFVFDPPPSCTSASARNALDVRISSLVAGLSLVLYLQRTWPYGPDCKAGFKIMQTHGLLSGIALHIVILLLHRGEPSPSHVLVQRLLSIVSSRLNYPQFTVWWNHSLRTLEFLHSDG